MTLVSLTVAADVLSLARSAVAVPGTVIRRSMRNGPGSCQFEKIGDGQMRPAVDQGHQCSMNKDGRRSDWSATNRLHRRPISSVPWQNGDEWIKLSQLVKTTGVEDGAEDSITLNFTHMHAPGDATGKIIDALFVERNGVCPHA
jgi:hypothetical protein